MANWYRENFTEFNKNLRIRCFAHILNIAVQDAYDNLSSLISDIRSKVSLINNSSKQHERFLKILEKNGKNRRLISDVVTQWNSR